MAIFEKDTDPTPLPTMGTNFGTFPAAIFGRCCCCCCLEVLLFAVCGLTTSLAKETSSVGADEAAATFTFLSVVPGRKTSLAKEQSSLGSHGTLAPCMPEKISRGAAFCVSAASNAAPKQPPVAEDRSDDAACVSFFGSTPCTKCEENAGRVAGAKLKATGKLAMGGVANVGSGLAVENGSPQLAADIVFPEPGLEL